MAQDQHVYIKEFFFLINLTSRQTQAGIGHSAQGRTYFCKNTPISQD